MGYPPRTRTAATPSITSIRTPCTRHVRRSLFIPECPLNLAMTRTLAIPPALIADSSRLISPFPPSRGAL